MDFPTNRNFRQRMTWSLLHIFLVAAMWLVHIVTHKIQMFQMFQIKEGYPLIVIVFYPGPQSEDGLRFNPQEPFWRDYTMY